MKGSTKLWTALYWAVVIWLIKMLPGYLEGLDTETRIDVIALVALVALIVDGYNYINRDCGDNFIYTATQVMYEIYLGINRLANKHL